MRDHSLGQADTHRPCSHRSDAGGRQAGCDPSAFTALRIAASATRGTSLMGLITTSGV